MKQLHIGSACALWIAIAAGSGCVSTALTGVAVVQPGRVSYFDESGRLSCASTIPEAKCLLSASGRPDGAVSWVDTAYDIQTWMPNGRVYRTVDRAYAVQWSPTGRLLAVLQFASDAGPFNARLTVRDDDGDELFSAAVPLRAWPMSTRVGSERYWGYRISWSPSERLLVVSTDPTDYVSTPVEAALIDLPGRTVTYLPNVCNVCFMTEDLVGAELGAPRALTCGLFQLGAGREAMTGCYGTRALLPAGCEIAGNDPLTGRLFVWDRPPFWIATRVYARDARLAVYGADGRRLATSSTCIPIDSYLIVATAPPHTCGVNATCTDTPAKSGSDE